MPSRRRSRRHVLSSSSDEEVQPPAQSSDEEPEERVLIRDDDEDLSGPLENYESSEAVDGSVVRDQDSVRNGQEKSSDDVREDVEGAGSEFKTQHASSGEPIVNKSTIVPLDARRVFFSNNDDEASKLIETPPSLVNVRETSKSDDGSRQQLIDRMRRELQALIEAEDEAGKILPNSSSSVVPVEPRGLTPPPSRSFMVEEDGAQNPSFPQVRNQNQKGKTQISLDTAERPPNFTETNATSGATGTQQDVHTTNAPAPAQTAPGADASTTSTLGTPTVPTPSARRTNQQLPPLPPIPSSKPVEKSGEKRREEEGRMANGQVVLGSAGHGSTIVGRRLAEPDASNTNTTVREETLNKTLTANKTAKECECGICTRCRTRSTKQGTQHPKVTLRPAPTVAEPQGRVIPRVTMPAHLSSNGRVPNPHDGNVGILLRAAWPYGDVIRCLEASKDEDGDENLEIAQEHLEHLRLWRLQNINANCKDKAEEEGQEEAPDRIKADSEVALYIAVNADHIDAVLHMMDVHDHARTLHDADHFRTAANLMANPKVKNDKIAARLPSFALRKMALAVVNDCEKCGALRAQKAAAKKDAEERAERKAREVASAASAEASRLQQKAAKEAQESRKRKEDEQRRSRTPPLPDDDDDLIPGEDFDLADSEWKSKKRSGHCWACGEGDMGGDKQYIVDCEVCEHTFHKPCTKFAKVQHTKSREVRWACLGCVRTPPANWKLMTLPAKDAPRRESLPPATETPANVARHLFDAPSGGGSGGGGDGGGGGGNGGGGGGGGGGNGTPFPYRTPNSERTEGLDKKARISYHVKPYEMWQGLPKGHSFVEEHPTKGFSKNAYMNWKRINVQLRDQSRGELGPLTNALSAEMRTSVGNILLTYDDVRPKRNMTSKEVSDWIRKEGYSWVTSLTDGVLLKKLDTHFSVLESDPFLSMSFPANIPQMNEDQSVNYMTNAHSAFADEWLYALGELRAGGWDDSSTDLRQAYIKALAPSPTLFNAASCYKTDSHDLLISYLRSWTQQQSSRQASENHLRQQIKKSLLKAEAPAAGAKPTTPASPQSKKETKDAAALRSEVRALQTQIKEMQHAAPTAKNSMIFFCHGCGYEYVRDSRKIPCEEACVFEEHADHNTGYKSGVKWPQDKRKLFWGSPEEYQRKYGKEMPEKGKLYLQMRAKWNETKRPDSSKKY
jgi:hypothetical protein